MARRWNTLKEKEFNELLRLSRLFHREAIRCRDARSYVSGCAAAGAALESVLLAILHLYPREVEKADLVPKRRGRPKHLFSWTFSEMLRVASAVGWLPVGLTPGGRWVRRKAKIGDYVEALRQARNLIHPARYVQDIPTKRITRRYLVFYIEVFEVAAQYLNSKVMESLRKKLRLP